VGQFIPYSGRYKNPLEQLWQEIDCTDEYQVIERPGIGNDQPHAV
jgi:hypothetical protein